MTQRVVSIAKGTNEEKTKFGLLCGIGGRPTF